MKTLTFDYDNVQGIALMYAVAVTSFYQCVQDPITKQYELTLVNNNGVIQIPVYKNESFSHSEVQSLEDGGDCWEVSVSGIIPKRCRLNEEVVHLLERGEWLTLTQDTNGTIVLSGTTEVPLKFVHSRSTGGNGEMNGSRFTFSAKEAAPSIVLSSLPTIS